MSLLNNSVAGNDPSSGREKSGRLFRPEPKANRDGSSGIKPKEAMNNRLTFADDYMSEHSRSGMCLRLIVVPGNTGDAPQKSQRTSECFGFPS